MKNLLIVESPAKIKTILKIVGKDFKIMSTIGHIIDLPPKKLGVTIEDGAIVMEYVPLQDKEKVIAEICKAAQNAQHIYLAPDPDREGEIIAWHIGKEIEKVIKKKQAMHRITFNEITASAITEALQHPGQIDIHKVNAQQARRVLDRWVGYEVSPILWTKISPGLSAGRVQSVALRLIVDREEAIRAFKPEEYWTINGIFHYAKEPFTATLAHINKEKISLKNQRAADTVVDDLKKQSYVVQSVEDKIRNKNPLAPFMTSSLQQAAYNRLGFSVKKTMQIAQKLYEGVPLAHDNPEALITYMRTDSLRISDTALKNVRSYINTTYSKEYLPSKPNLYGKKGRGKTQDAHEAIRPIDVNVAPESIKQYLSPDEAKLYTLIWQRFVASQMNAAQYAQRTVVVTGGKYEFRATGSTLIFDGFLKVYGVEEDEEENSTIPADIKAKAPVGLKKVEPKQHFTQPPPRYTEASLVKELEKEGIGRPSTYATILNTIRARDYTKLDEKKRFVPTELGSAVTKLLEANLPHIMDIKFTAHMEEDLDKIANGKLDRDKLLKKFYKEFQADLKKFKGEEKGKRAAIATDIRCPKCKKHMLHIKFGKSGEFLGCESYPACDFTSNFERTESGEIKIIKTEPPKILKEKCPQCGKPMRKLNGRFGEFIACSGYPECKYIKREVAWFPCPSDKGEVVQRVWRGGKFWGCSNYPKCKFAIFDEIVKEKCPQCKLPFLIKKTDKEGNVTLLCFDKTCGYKK